MEEVAGMDEKRGRVRIREMKDQDEPGERRLIRRGSKTMSCQLLTKQCLE